MGIAKCVHRPTWKRVSKTVCLACDKEITPVLCIYCDGTGTEKGNRWCHTCEGTGVVRWEEAP